MSFNSYAQNFEDVMLWRALGHVQNGFYIDVGAQHPIVDSVSLAFHEHGWHGIHIEPLSQYADLLRQQRPGDVVLQAAVGQASEVLPFYEIPDSGISTADPEIAASHRARGYVTRELVVPCVTLASIFDMCRGKDIHWLKIDVEGYENQVLVSWGKSPARPWIVVVESTMPLSQVETHQAWEGHLIRLGYVPAYFDGLNRYYVAATHPELKDAFKAPPNVFDGFTLNGTASAPFQSLIEQRYRDQLAARQSESDAKVAAVQAEVQAAIERAAQMEQAHVDAVAKLEQAQSGQLAQLQQDHARQVANLEQERADRLAQLEQAHDLQIAQSDELQRRLGDQAELLKGEIGQLLREQTDRERESAARLLASQEQAAQERAMLVGEWTQLSQRYLAQAEERQQHHLEREQALMHQLHGAHEDRRHATTEINRLQAVLETVSREATDRVEAIYQRAALEKEQTGRAHEQRIIQTERDHAEQQSALETHARGLTALLEEHKLHGEKLAEALSLLGARLDAEQQTASRLQQDLAVARQVIEETRKTISWRLTRPLRYLASTLATGK